MRIIIAFISLVLISSCGLSEGADRYSKSAGRVDEIMVVMEDDLWKGDTIGTLVRDVLEEEYPGLPQIEPRFDVRHVGTPNLARLIRRMSTIIYVGILDEPGLVNKYIKDNYENIPKQRGDNHFTLSNVWATPQQVIFVYGKNKAALLNYLANNGDELIEIAYRLEDKKALNSIFASGNSEGSQQVLKTKYGIDMKMPNKFRQATINDSLIWFRQDIEGEVSNIVIQVRDLGEHEIIPEKAGELMRNNYGKALVTSDTPGSHMITEMSLPPITETVNFKGTRTVKSTGLWRMSGDFMGGPFVNYAIQDRKNNKLIIIDGFVYAPQYPKRRPMHKLEMLIQSIRVNN